MSAGVVMAAAALAVAAMPAWAQSNGAGRRGGRFPQQQQGPASPDTAPAPARPASPSVQRLDAGALLCTTEVQLEQHEAAVIARLNGRDAVEPTGCHLVQSPLQVSVVDRHGPSHTQVRLQTGQGSLGWTDAMVR